MADPPSAPEVARALADALESRSIPYAIGGAIAYGFHAPPRATNDVDLKVFLEPDALGPALEALGAAGAVLDAAASMRAAGERGDSSVAVRGMRVDVFVPSIPLYESARDRVQTVSLLGRPIRVLSAEDLVVFKMLFFRGKDLGDIERLLAFRGQDLDRAYVRRWLVELVGADDARVERWDSLARNSP